MFIDSNDEDSDKIRLEEGEYRKSKRREKKRGNGRTQEWHDAGKRRKRRSEMTGKGKVHRRKTGIDEQRDAEINDREVIREEDSNDVMSDDEDWSDGNVV